MGGPCSTNELQEQFLQDFGWEESRKKNPLVNRTRRNKVILKCVINTKVVVRGLE